MTRLALLSLIGLAACAPETPTYDGAQAFQAQCASCHGALGRGNGPLAEGLSPAPSDLTTLTRRFGGTYPADHVMTAIDGYNRGAHFSAAMPRFGDGDLGPMIMTEEDGNPMPIPAELLALSNYIETLQR
ncbi:c-type cytochrome [Salipiger sp. IMCC34102]|uniref:c-type cytochrome n=1 Tax=Salipiger sp. IMCC34102 TaxID=2510647 RepID=UPI00101D59B3|nr:cytochrome c [Salipiger sp. IMCC34102]RYH02301.1 c-type cytochrome [Salipiger sp. IMCC34102]